MGTIPFLTGSFVAAGFASACVIIVITIFFKSWDAKRRT